MNVTLEPFYKNSQRSEYNFYINENVTKEANNYNTKHPSNYTNIELLQDAFLIDTGKDVIVWVGKKASQAEKKSGLMYAHVSRFYSQRAFELHSCNSSEWLCSYSYLNNIYLSQYHVFLFSKLLTCFLPFYCFCENTEKHFTFPIF